MADVTVKIELREEQIKRFAQSDDMQHAMERLAQFVEGSAKGYAPVRTGNLRRSITHDVERERLSWVARVGTNVRYGIFQEVGTINHPPHPFLRPALSDLQRVLRGSV